MIVDYARLYDLTMLDFERLLFLLREMDREYLAYTSEKREQDAAAAKVTVGKMK